MHRVVILKDSAYEHLLQNAINLFWYSSYMDGIEWFKNAIIYHIFIDRFAGFKETKDWEKPDFLGGNIKGIIQKIPYLKDLGITTIWISPFYKTSVYHGYHITDFFSVDSHFGTKKDVEMLIRAVHDNEMKIIADFVPNHCSKDHPYFKEAQSNMKSKYYDWFYFTNWPDEYLCFLSIHEIPKLNLDNHEVKKHIVDAAKYWLSLGFDGYRLDHVLGPSHRFWKEFRSEIKSDFPDVILIGEAWMMGIKRKELKTIHVPHKLLRWFFGGSSSSSLFKEYISELDGVLDFKFQELIRKYITNPNYSQKTFQKNVKKHYACFPKNFFLPTFLDNHDMDRFLFYCKNDKEKLKDASVIQFSIDQPAIIYYGTEVGMTQEKSMWNIKSQGDLQVRQPMNWENKDSELIDFYKKLIELKKNNIFKD